MNQNLKNPGLNEALRQIRSRFGTRVVHDPKTAKPATVIPTGSLSLDAALGLGGFPRGRIVELYGPESSGKTTIALQVIKEAQRAGGVCAYVDAEHALDHAYARKLGVDPDRLIVLTPDDAEQGFEMIKVLVESGELAVVVVDSVAALMPRVERTNEIGVATDAQAILMSQALRMLSGPVARTDTCLIFVNQVREKSGAMFGNPETTTGGRALRYYASVRVELRRIAAIREGNEVIGSRIKVKIVKSKVAAPFREVEIDLLHGEGISLEGDLLDLGLANNVIRQAGSSLTYRQERLGAGREEARRILKERADIREQLVSELRARLQAADRVAPEPSAILLVEDDPMVRPLLRHILEKTGYNILEASDGEEALEVAKNYDGVIGMLVTDVVMPRLNGAELARRLLQQNPNLKVMFISGHALDPKSMPPDLASDIVVLKKPFAPSNLIDRIREILASQRTSSKATGS